MILLPTVFDVGARYGPHPSWSQLFGKDLCIIHAFEPEIEEYRWLENMFSNNGNYSIANIGLGHANATMALNIQRHQGQASFLTPNLGSNWFRVARPDDGITSGKQENIRVVRAEDYIDDCMNSQILTNPPQFLKTDTEGYDLNVIIGFGRHLESLYAIRTEVLFSQAYNNASDFGEIHHYLLNNKFRLANLDYNGCGDAQSFYAPPNTAYGILNATEALYIREDDYYDRLSTEQLPMLIAFLFCNRLCDYAVYLLERRSDEFSKLYSTVNSQLLTFIEHEFLVYGKKFENFSKWHYSGCKELYQCIFNRTFPEMHQFYRYLNTLFVA